MTVKSLCRLATIAACWLVGGALAAESSPFVRIAELEIDPAQLESYKTAVREEMESRCASSPA
jgi:hypothetical protein